MCDVSVVRGKFRRAVFVHSSFCSSCLFLPSGKIEGKLHGYALSDASCLPHLTRATELKTQDCEKQFRAGGSGG